MIVSVARASCQERRNSSTAAPASVSVFWSSEMTPSVTSWSSASTSFVSRLIEDAGPVSLVEAEREPLQVAEEVVAQVGEHPLARPAGEVGLPVGADDPEHADADERGDDRGPRFAVLGCLLRDAG